MQAPAAPPADPIERLARRAGPPLVAAAAVAMLAWTWFTWPDPVVDFGRETYTAWQLSEGKVLYRDVAYFNGPLSPYVNSVVFRVLGVSVRSIVVANLVVFALILVMVWRLWVLIADYLAATLACLMLVGVFAFLQLSGVANYNFVTPYSHELTHGTALSLAAMTCLAGYLRRPRDVTVAGAGLLVGLIFLTKAEVFLAAGAAVGIGVIVALWSARASPRRAARAMAQFGLSALVPPVVALVLLLTAMPWGDALRGVLGSWVYVFDPRISSMRFYQRVFGTLDPGNNVAAMLESFIWWGASFGSVAAVAIAIRRLKSTAQPWAFVIALVVASTIFWFVYRRAIVMPDDFRGLTLVMLGTFAGSLVRVARRGRGSASPDARLVMQFVVATFALLMLGKMLLNVLLYHYGFALAMPAALVTAALLVSWWPGFVDRRGGTGAVLRGAGVAAVLFVIGLHLHFHQIMGTGKATRVAAGADAFRADVPKLNLSGGHRGRAVNLMLDALARLPAHATLATVPEGTMINYLARRPNPTPYVNLMPPEVLMFGEERILRAYQERPPDYIVIVQRSDPGDYGYKSFAHDYGRRIYAWIESNYKLVPAPTEPSYPMLLLERKP